jgi:signal transduction histidine kinase
MTTFRVATEADDALLRSILRDNGMPTWVEMAIQREPSFFSATDLFGRDWAVIAEEGGDVIGMYTAAVVPVHVDGQPERIGYLGGLRVRPAYRRRIRHLREGYDSIRPLAPSAGTRPGWFTVVAAENENARRLLEAGVRGLPAYHPQGDYVTFALPVSRGRRRELWRAAAVDDIAAIVTFYNGMAARFQYSPVLDATIINQIGIAHFYLYERNGALQGVAALWDQRAFKQIVARRYRQPLRALLGVYNAYARLLRRIPLPAEGGALDQTFLAFLALSDQALVNARELVEDLLSHCRTAAASIGLCATHPLIPVVKRFKPISYPARVYAVSFEGTAPPHGRPAQPEAALL